MLVEGIRGAEPLRWCACGEHILELVGQFVVGRPSLADGSGEYTYEYSHMPKCPTCVDREKNGDLCHAYREHGLDCLQPAGHEGDHGDASRTRMA